MNAFLQWSCDPTEYQVQYVIVHYPQLLWEGIGCSYNRHLCFITFFCLPFLSRTRIPYFVVNLCLNHFTFDHRASKLFIFEMPSQKRKRVVSISKKLESVKRINNGESLKNNCFGIWSW